MGSLLTVPYYKDKNEVEKTDDKKDQPEPAKVDHEESKGRARGKAQEKEVKSCLKNNCTKEKMANDCVD